MASGMYENGVREIMRGNVDLINDTISALLVSASYAPDLSVDTVLSDIPEAARLSDVELTGNTIDVATFRADDATFNSVSSDLDPVVAVVLFKNSGAYSTSALLTYIDNASEFPIAPDDTDIIISWDTGSDGIFSL